MFYYSTKIIIKIESLNLWNVLICYTNVNYIYIYIDFKNKFEDEKIYFEALKKLILLIYDNNNNVLSRNYINQILSYFKFQT